MGKCSVPSLACSCVLLTVAKHWAEQMQGHEQLWQPPRPSPTTSTPTAPYIYPEGEQGAQKNHPNPQAGEKPAAPQSLHIATARIRGTTPREATRAGLQDARSLTSPEGQGQQPAAGRPRQASSSSESGLKASRRELADQGNTPIIPKLSSTHCPQWK